MSTVKLTDDALWQVGDMFYGEHKGHAFSGPLWSSHSMRTQLRVGDMVVRSIDGGLLTGITGYATREVSDIAEPTEPGAVVRFTDGYVAVRVPGVVRARYPWSGTDGSVSWNDLVGLHGTVIAVAHPVWDTTEESSPVKYPRGCSYCGASYDSCNATLRARGTCCCSTCHQMATHEQNAWEKEHRGGSL